MVRRAAGVDACDVDDSVTCRGSVASIPLRADDDRAFTSSFVAFAA
jgi:hypothetical protein